MNSLPQTNLPLPVSSRFFDDSIDDAIPISCRHRPFHLRSYRLRPIDKKPRIAYVGVFDTLAAQKVALGGDRTPDH